MHETYTIIDEWRKAEATHGEAVLATVAHVEGSAYRRPGARMLILADGRRFGSISGGCLETDLVKKCWWFTESGEPSVRVYDTTSDDDAVWEFGLGCNGVVHVLLERTGSAAAGAALEFLWRWRQSAGKAVMATVIRTDDPQYAVGDRLFMDEGGPAYGALTGSPAEYEIARQADLAMRSGRSRLVHIGGAEVFVEYLAPPQALVIFGAGHDAVPVVAIAKQLGWHVTVADGRPAYARPDRFPGVDRVVLISRRDPLEGIDIGPETAVVMMTHNYPQDTHLLPLILQKQPRYLGLLGPRKRAVQLFTEAGEKLAGADVHAPVGLDIGAETPEGIALSVISEIQAELAGRTGGKLRYRMSPIHIAPDEAGRPMRQEDVPSEPVVCGVSLQ